VSPEAMAETTGEATGVELAHVEGERGSDTTIVSAGVKART